MSEDQVEYDANPSATKMLAEARDSFFASHEDLPYRYLKVVWKIIISKNTSSGGLIINDTKNLLEQAEEEVHVTNPSAPPKEDSHEIKKLKKEIKSLNSKIKSMGSDLRDVKKRLTEVERKKKPHRHKMVNKPKGFQ